MLDTSAPLTAVFHETRRRQEAALGGYARQQVASMARLRLQLSTGLPGLDRVFRGLMPGDNIVWRVDTVDDYRPFIRPYGEHANRYRQKLVYFRFADHAPLLDESMGAEVYHLHPDAGFEPFIAEIHKVINSADRGTLYLFDCLSQLAPDWNSDRMLGNFFMLTCPYLYDRAAVAYFSILRNYHSFHAINPISNTTQIFVDVYRHSGNVYIQPSKVQHRHSATMNTLHEWKGDLFIPVTNSAVITETLSGTPWGKSDLSNYQMGVWSKTFTEAEAIESNRRKGVDGGTLPEVYFKRILRMLISHEPRVLKLAETYFTLHDMLNIRRRMIGTGLIGGKSVGMLLARAILERTDHQWTEKLEKHDSFFVGADVFYTYLVQNGCWWMMQKHKTGLFMDDETETARRRVLAGDFPDYIVKQFSDMLDYFGQSPIIVRSSSLLEDNFGNAFAGKYDSVFCANQGGSHKRLEDFLCAVRTVYASTMGEEALAYRSKRGLSGYDERMALLVQRVSGASYGNMFFPQAAGVGFSFNPYVWDPDIDPEAGVIRLVFGVGTRAVDRSDDDYTRVVALNAPTKRPEANFEEVRSYAQRRVDVLDLEANQLASKTFEDIAAADPDLHIDIFASRDRKLERDMRDRGQKTFFPWVLTFDKLLSETGFVPDMRAMLDLLKTAYDYPVDIEFTLNFSDADHYKINIVQCRPLQGAGVGESTEMPDHISDGDIMLESSLVIGKNKAFELDWVVYVVPPVYGALPTRDRYAVARLISDIAHHGELDNAGIMMIGPGRWGTTTPELGIPVTSADIMPVSVLCEIVAMHGTLTPDASLGTHFFNEMVENDMSYIAVFPERVGNTLNTHFFEQAAPNRLESLLPAEAEWNHAVKVFRARDIPQCQGITFHANTLKQRAVCGLHR